MNPITPTQAMRLLAELLELDRQFRHKRQPLSFAQKQRRAQIALDLHRWALLRQQRDWGGGGVARRDPRSRLSLQVRLVGGPRPLLLQSDSLAIGGMSLTLGFPARVGDRLHLQLVPPPPDEAIALQAEVVWFTAARQRAGVRFHELSEEARALLERLIYADLVGGGDPP